MIGFVLTLASGEQSPPLWQRPKSLQEQTSVSAVSVERATATLGGSSELTAHLMRSSRLSWQRSGASIAPLSLAHPSQDYPRTQPPVILPA